MKIALNQAHEGRMHILGKMAESLAEPRADISSLAPRIQSFTIDKNKIGDVIGTGGKVIREITEKTGAKIEITDDGLVSVAAVDGEAGKAAVDWIKGIVAEPEVGQIYDGTVCKIMDFGAFVTFMPNRDGLVHVSEIRPERVEKVTDVLKEGDKVKVKCMGIERGKVRLSMKRVNQETGEEIPVEKKPKKEKKEEGEQTQNSAELADILPDV